MNEASENLLASLTIKHWQPQSLQPHRQQLLRLRWRVLILVGIALLHILGARWLLLATNGNVATDEVALVIDFIDASPQPRSGIYPVPVPKFRKPIKIAKSKGKLDVLTEITPTLPSSVTPSSLHGPKQSLQLYNSEGRLRVPDDLLDQLDKQVGDQRVFSYQIPHIDDAKKYFDRNPALVYETTRFEQYWKPDQDMLTELLTKFAEKTIKEIRIPIPGHPASTIVCAVSLLALGGSCSIQTNGANYVGPVDDPSTLSAEEERQCQAWWNQIIGAKTQELWRKTRSLYESECRKPLAHQK